MTTVERSLPPRIRDQAEGSRLRQILGSWAPRAGALLILAVFLTALVPRVVGAGSVLTVDESKWIPRSVQYYTSITEFYDDFKLKTYTPGVTTMTLVGLPLRIAGIVTGEDTTTEYSVRFPGYTIPLAQLTIGVTTALLVAGAYALLRQLVREPVAPLIAGLLLALDPFFLAHSRVVHTDALLAGFGLLSVLAFLVFVDQRPSGLGYLAMSGALVALASLTKVSGLIVAAFIVLYYLYVTLSDGDIRARDIRKYCLHIGIWGGAFVATAVVVWPMLLLDPVGSLSKIIETVNGARTTSDPSYFFMGQITQGSSNLFYAVVLAHKATPVVMVGFVAAIVTLFRPSNGSERRLVLALLAFALFFLGVIAFTAKHGSTYMLPLYVALVLAAGIGLTRAVSFATVWRSSRLFVAGGGALLAAYVVWTVVTVHPHYLAYNNELLGGTAVAQERFYVGWGEGLDLVAEYLNEKDDAWDLTVGVYWTHSLKQMFKGATVHFRGETPDYVVLYSSQNQLRRPPRIFNCYSSLEPEKTVYIRGAPYAQIYRVTNDAYYQACGQTVPAGARGQ